MRKRFLRETMMKWELPSPRVASPLSSSTGTTDLVQVLLSSTDSFLCHLYRIAVSSRFMEPTAIAVVAKDPMNIRNSRIFISIGSAYSNSTPNALHHKSLGLRFHRLKVLHSSGKTGVRNPQLVADEFLTVGCCHRQYPHCHLIPFHQPPDWILFQRHSGPTPIKPNV